MYHGYSFDWFESYLNDSVIDGNVYDSSKLIENVEFTVCEVEYNE